MRVIAAIYLAIALAEFGFWFAGRTAFELFPTPYYYVTWSLYFFSLLALFCYVIAKPLLPGRAWQAVFMAYATIRTYELLTRGLVFTGDNLPADLNILLSYLWLVLPPGLAMWYLGFVQTKKRSSKTAPAIAPNILSPR